ncbi:MAG TPA: hypothetical protein VFW07_06370 [Parafilimonas sp.]|nr:hypothetical protein [Parafilimonas sp.]
MESSSLKKQLHEYIDMIEDEEQLEMLNDAAQAYATKQSDILDLLTSEELEKLKESIEQANRGETTPHEEVMKMANGWIQKK